MADKTYVYVGAEANGLYRKDSGDQQWQQLTNGMPPSAQVRAIAIHPQNPDVVFVGTQRGVYRSQDRGDLLAAYEPARGKGRLVIAVSPAHATGDVSGH